MLIRAKHPIVLEQDSSLRFPDRDVPTVRHYLLGQPLFVILDQADSASDSVSSTSSQRSQQGAMCVHIPGLKPHGPQPR